MSLITELNAVSKVQVGASAEYPVVRIDRRVEVSAPEESGTPAQRHETWTLQCVALATDALPANIAALFEQVQSELATRGQAVTLTELGGVRTMPAGGGATGSRRGYPRVEVRELPESFGPWLMFELSAETYVPLPDEITSLVSHEYTREESEDDEGLVSIRQSGTYRTANNVDAKADLITNVIDAARATATAANHAFTVRYTTGLDQAVVSYEFTDSERSTSGSGGIEQAEVNDRLTRSNDGRHRRIVSGYAVGSSASTYASSQRPTPGSSELLVGDNVGQPSVPDGRVDFSYELLVGVTDAAFPGIVIFGFRETIGRVSGGRRALVSEFYDAAPIVRLGTEGAYFYAQSSSIEFKGDWEAHGLIPIMDADAIAADPIIRKESGPFGLRRVQAEWLYVFTTRQLPDPNPTEIDFFA